MNSNLDENTKRLLEQNKKYKEKLVEIKNLISQKQKDFSSLESKVRVHLASLFLKENQLPSSHPDSQKSTNEEKILSQKVNLFANKPKTSLLQSRTATDYFFVEYENPFNNFNKKKQQQQQQQQQQVTTSVSGEVLLEGVVGGSSCSRPTPNIEEIQNSPVFQRLPLSYKVKKWSTKEVRQLKEAIATQSKEYQISNLLKKYEDFNNAMDDFRTPNDSTTITTTRIIQDENVGATPSPSPSGNEVPQLQISDESIEANLNSLITQTTSSSSAGNDNNNNNNNNNREGRRDFKLPLSELKKEITMIGEKDTSATISHLTSVEMNAFVNWELISLNVFKGERSPFELSKKWFNEISEESNNSSRWTKSEEMELFKTAKAHNHHNFINISKQIGNRRTPLICFMKFQRSLNNEMIKSKWSEEEDKILRNAVGTYGKKNWQQVASTLVGRTGQQCLHRWTKTLNPKIRKGKWEKEEDLRLYLANIAYNPENKKSSSSSSSSAATSKWVGVQGHIPVRTDVQCRERWCNILNPAIKTGQWTKQEDQLLLETVERVGAGKWAKVAEYLHPRTDNQCWRRWKVLSDKTEYEKYQENIIKKDKLFLKNFVGREKERPNLNVNDIQMELLQNSANSGSTSNLNMERIEDDEDDENEEEDIIQPTPKKRRLTRGRGRGRGGRSKDIHQQDDDDDDGDDDAEEEEENEEEFVEDDDDDIPEGDDQEMEN